MLVAQIGAAVAELEIEVETIETAAVEVAVVAAGIGGLHRLGPTRVVAGPWRRLRPSQQGPE